MKIQYDNNFVQKLGVSDTTTCAYQLIYNENDKNDTHITQYFIMHGLGLCIKVDSYLGHMFYAWPFSHNTEFPISKNKNKSFLLLNTNTTVFYWGTGNTNKNRIY